MAAVSSSLCEEQFLCSICLEVFTDPVTTPCGHNFCSICINKHWHNSVHCSCPVCKQDFSPRPQLKVNTLLLEVVSQLRNKPQDEDTVIDAPSTAPGEDCDLSTAPGEVCDLSTAPGEVCDMSTAPGEVCDLYTAPGEVYDITTAPEEVCDLCTAPGEVYDMSTAPGEVDCDLSTAPGEVCDLSTAPGEVCDLSTAPGEVCDLSTAPGELCDLSTAPGEFCDMSTAPGEVCDPSTAPGEVCDPSTVPGEVCDLSTAPGEVVCDICPEPRLRALKSCLLCLMSYCESHLQSHLTHPRLKRHQLIHPLPNLEEHICPEHQRPLDLFCREHSHFMCMQCIYTEDTKHHTVLLKEQGEEQQATLKKQIKERRVIVQEIQRSVEQSQRKADAEIQEGLRVFTALMECVQQCADSFKQSIVEKHQKMKEEASQLIEQIQTEICELEQRGAEMEQLWTSGDHLSFVQTFTTVKPAPQLCDWSQKTYRTPSYKGTGAQAVSELRNKLNTEMETFFKAELEKVQEFAAEVSLDPNTAHPFLVLSKDLKQVHLGDQRQNLRDNPDRFTSYLCVLGKQKFSSGKFYFEVQVKGKTDWEVGVAKESVDRKDEDSQTVQKGYWLLYMDDGRYKTSDDPRVVLSVQSCPEKVGVFVDYDEGLVSFYDVDKKSLLCSYSDCGFTDNILPIFNPCTNSKGTNSAPLVLTPVGS